MDGTRLAITTGRARLGETSRLRPRYSKIIANMPRSKTSVAKKSTGANFCYTVLYEPTIAQIEQIDKRIEQLAPKANA